MSQAESSSSATRTTTEDMTEDDWTSVTDPTERRRIQNRIAQRKFREKSKQKREEAEREAENVERAGGSYTTAEPHEVQSHQESGLPWGGLSLDHVIATGKTKEQNSRESSMNAAAVSRAGGGSSRLGLHLIDKYARGSPAWDAWRARLAPFISQRTAQPHRTWQDTGQDRTWEDAGTDHTWQDTGPT